MYCRTSKPDQIRRRGGNVREASKPGPAVKHRASGERERKVESDVDFVMLALRKSRLDLRVWINIEVSKVVVWCFGNEA